LKNYESFSKEAIRKLIKDEICRRSFWDFCLFYDNNFFTRRPFLKQVADLFQSITDGKIKSASVSMPPRAGKSYITSLYSAWLIGNNPSGSVMRNCCTSRLYEKFSYDTRDILRSEKFKELFNVHLSADKQSVRGWNTTQAKQVSYFGDGVGGTIIGFGATLIAITDDLFRSYEDATSQQILERTHSWYEGTHQSRIEKNCPRIDIGTRWSKYDVIGINQQEKRYDVSLTIPALIDGKSFCEDVKTTEEYLDLKQRTSPEIWGAEYMQEPIEATGTLFKKSELKTYNETELPKHPDAILAYVDVADEGSDYFCMVVGRVKEKKVFITDVIFTKDNVDITLPRTQGLIESSGLSYVRVEVNGQGSMFTKMIRNGNEEKVLRVTNSTNKHTRILMAYGFIKEYCYFKEAHRGSEYFAFMENILEYSKAGKSKNDDAPDALSGLVKFIQSFLPHVFN
jgi:predicted phage terminase large subunit-like protein